MVSEEEVVAAFKAHCSAKYGRCDYPDCDCDRITASFEDELTYMRAALEAAATVRESKAALIGILSPMPLTKAHPDD